MQRYMLRLMLILAVIGFFSAPVNLFRWLRRSSSPGTGGSAPMLHRPAA
jgi:hypothetical protein